MHTTWRHNNGAYCSLAENNVSFKDVFQEIPVKVRSCKYFFALEFIYIALNVAYDRCARVVIYDTICFAAVMII